MHSGLRRVGEAVKPINENLLTCGYMQAYAYACSARVCARSFVNCGGRWKSGEERERKWGGSEEGGVIVGRKGNQWKYEGEEDGGEREGRNEKAFTLCTKGSAGKIKGEISRRSARSGGKYKMKQGKSEFRG